MSDEVARARVLAQVEQWLARGPAEELPEALADAMAESGSEPGDLAAWTGAMLALRQEAQAQTRALRRLEERLATALDELAEARRKLAERSAPKSESAGLVELHDRLRRCETAGLESAESLPWWNPRAAVRGRIEGLTEGISLTVERARELLAEQGLRTFDPCGERFDPQRMRAVDTGTATSNTPDGHVLATRRVGLERQVPGAERPEMVRPAEVIVARASGQKTHG